jgi:potassium-dependent mechanosensitive channel
MTSFHGRRLLMAAMVVLGTALGACVGSAQGLKATADSSVVVSSDTKAIRTKLDAFKTELDQKENALGGREFSDADLQRLKHGIEPVAESIRSVIDELGPKLDASKARLDQLGPKPKDGQPDESADVAKERAEREAAVAELDETQRLGRTLLLQAEQITTQIVDRRRAVFTRALFEQSAGLLSPTLWFDVVQALPRELLVQRTVLMDAFEYLRRNATPGALLLVGLALGTAIALYVGRRSIAPRLVTRDPSVLEPSRRSRLLAALAVLLLGAVPAMLGSWVVWVVFDSVNVLPPRLEGVIAAVLGGLAFVAFTRALVDAVLAPGHTPWRLVSLTEAAATRVITFAVALATVIGTGKALETFNQAVAAALPITVATRAVFAFACALLVAELLRRFATHASQDEACLGPYVAPDVEISGPVRVLGWTGVATVIVSVLGGYVALASFLVDQAARVTILLALLLLGIAIADEFIGGTLRGQTRIATALQANTGLRRRSLEQIGVLATGMTRVVLILVALLLVLAPWGIESTDLMASMRAAFFGFQVGEVTISLSAIVIAGLLFALGFAITRVVQRWLDTTFLPATDLDAGLRNSIRTGFGYVGVIAAGAIAISHLGLSLDRIAIVAGALSVGIGFGLQSIVNNFVSGLILLWERPIRVGDLVVVGDGEGYVRRINVRATEIETFDRSTVVVPNSNLISGVVRNRVRTDRTGRVIVTVPVPRSSDPDQVAEIMRTCALAHREVMSEPSPRVMFKKISDTSIEFDLVCFVDEIEIQGRISSDLYFAIYRCLRQAGIGAPAPVPTAIEVKGLEGMEEQLEHIAQAIELDHGPEAKGPAPIRARASEPALPIQALKPRSPAQRKGKDKPTQ